MIYDVVFLRQLLFFPMSFTHRMCKAHLLVDLWWGITHREAGWEMLADLYFLAMFQVYDVICKHQIRQSFWIDALIDRPQVDAHIVPYEVEHLLDARIAYSFR